MEKEISLLMNDGSIIIAGEKQRAEFNQEFNNFLKCGVNLIVEKEN